MIRRRALLSLVVMLLAGATLLAREDILIQPVPNPKEGRVLVSFTARDSWTLATRELLQRGGIDVRFDYDVELRRPGFIALFDQVLARVRISQSARFSTLAGAYTISRMRDGRVIQSDRRSSEAEVRDWLTTVDQVILEPIARLEFNAEYDVYVRLTTSPRPNFTLWSLWPFGSSDNAGRQSFTYVR